MRRAVSATIEPLEDRRLLSAAISLQNLDAIPGSTQMAFNRIQIPNPAVNDVVHDTNTLQIKNTGDSPLTISSLSLSDTTNWQLVDAPANGTSIAAGHTLDVTVKFVAQSVPPNQSTDETNDVVSTDSLPPSQTGGVWDGTLTINSNDPNTPVSTMQLAGYWQYESEHEEEPNLQTIVNDLFGYGTNISNTLQPQYQNNGTSAVAFGEEVLSAYWQAANPSQPVDVLQIAAYHNQQDLMNGQSPTAQIGWFAQGSSTVNTLFKHAANNSQSLLPPLFGTTSTPASGSFTTSATFGFNIDGESSVDSQNTTDINTYGRPGHTDRFYPARDAQGNLIPNTWILAMDYENGSYDNYDYQDNLYLITNVRPATQAPAVSNLTGSSTNGQVSLSWSAVSDGSLQGYNIYRSNSAGGTYTKLNSTPFNGTTYIDSSASGSTEYYEVSAVDSAGESEKAAVVVAVDSSQQGGGGGGSTGTTDGPDLTLSAVTGKFKTSVVGNSMSGPSKVTLTNSGNQTAKGTVQIALFVSPSQTDLTNATEVSHVNRNINLKAAKSVTLALSGFKYSSSLSGQYYLVAQVQAVKGITESNTSNNLGASSAITVAQPFVDLANGFTGSLPATFVPGKHTALVVPLTNKGNVAAHGVATVTITATTSSSGFGGTLLATVKLPVTLGAGKTAKFNVRLLVPTLSPGTYYIVTNVVLPGDGNSGNNAAVSTGTFTV
jgi:hypothetical protein